MPIPPAEHAATPVAPNASAVRTSAPTFPGSCTPASRSTSGMPQTKSSNVAARGRTRAAIPCGVSVAAICAKRRSLVCNILASAGIEVAICVRWCAPVSFTSTATIGVPECSAVSTNRAPSMPAISPFDASARVSPASAARNSLSQRFSRLVTISGLREAPDSPPERVAELTNAFADAGAVDGSCSAE